MKKINLIAAAVLMATASLSHAAGFYAAGSVGLAQLDDIDSDSFDSSTSFSVSGGYDINEMFAVEVAYLDFGETETSGVEDNVNYNATVDVTGVNLTVIGTYPVHEKVDLFAKMGVLVWDADVTVTEDGYSGTISDSGNDFSYGVGVAVNVYEQLSVVLQYQQFAFTLDGYDADMSNISLGARYNF